ncbi:hypothetical protein BDZ91DRAFT_778777 [Kalaharituber pfeilii]|nr:hypothetical protein BDZ91DRAFT_778777 [Kalaharituber pfeilii]
MPSKTPQHLNPVPNHPFSLILHWAFRLLRSTVDSSPSSLAMAALHPPRILFPSLTLLGLGLGLTTPYSPFRPTPHQCQPSTTVFSSHSHHPAFSILNPSTWTSLLRPAPPPPPPPPPPTALKTTFNPYHYRQISTGSFLGLFTGIAVARFSKPLGIVLGLLVFFVEFLAMRGIHIIPYERLERWLGGVDYKSAILDNIAFKIAFAAAFTVAAASSW